jgi:hypothetical protein
MTDFSMGCEPVGADPNHLSRCLPVADIVMTEPRDDDDGCSLRSLIAPLRDAIARTTAAAWSFEAAVIFDAAGYGEATKAADAWTDATAALAQILDINEEFPLTTHPLMVMRSRLQSSTVRKVLLAFIATLMWRCARRMAVQRRYLVISSVLLCGAIAVVPPRAQVRRETAELAWRWCRAVCQLVLNLKAAGEASIALAGRPLVAGTARVNAFVRPLRVFECTATVAEFTRHAVPLDAVAGGAPLPQSSGSNEVSVLQAISLLSAASSQFLLDLQTVDDAMHWIGWSRPVAVFRAARRLRWHRMYGLDMLDRAQQSLSTESDPRLPNSDADRGAQTRRFEDVAAAHAHVGALLYVLRRFGADGPVELDDIIAAVRRTLTCCERHTASWGASVPGGGHGSAGEEANEWWHTSSSDGMPPPTRERSEDVAIECVGADTAELPDPRAETTRRRLPTIPAALLAKRNAAAGQQSPAAAATATVSAVVTTAAAGQSGVTAQQQEQRRLPGDAVRGEMAELSRFQARAEKWRTRSAAEA